MQDYKFLCAAGMIGDTG